MFLNGTGYFISNSGIYQNEDKMSKTEVKKKVSRIKSVKKAWFRIVAPKLFAQKEIGETYLASAEVAIGRFVKVNLRELTGNIKDQNAYIRFQIVSASGSSLETKIMGYELTSSCVKRMVRKNCDRMDDYFVVVTKDGVKLVVKTLMLTTHKTHRSVQSQLRVMLQKGIREEASKNEFEAFMLNLSSSKMQFGLKKRLSKLYPLKEAAVRVLQVKGVGTPETFVEEQSTPAPSVASEEELN